MSDYWLLVALILGAMLFAISGLSFIWDKVAYGFWNMLASVIMAWGATAVWRLVK